MHTLESIGDSLDKAETYEEFHKIFEKLSFDYQLSVLGISKEKFWGGFADHILKQALEIGWKPSKKATMSISTTKGIIPLMEGKV